MIIKENLQNKISDEIQLARDEGIKDKDTIIRNVMISLGLESDRYNYIAEILNNSSDDMIKYIDDTYNTKEDNNPSSLFTKKVKKIDDNYFLKYCKGGGLHIHSNGLIASANYDKIVKLKKGFEKKNPDYEVIIDRKDNGYEVLYYYKGVRRKCQ